jgi:hypothetical protein
MRNYFKNLLQNLDKLSGLKQYEKLCQSQNPKEEITTLLDILCRVCEQFPYIPDLDKQKIINDAVVTDGEFIGLNARIVYKWLNLKKDQYFTELAHQDTPENEPLTGEAREARLNEWLQALNKTEVQLTQKVDVYAKVREDWQPKDGVKYKQTLTADDVLRHDLHIQYLKENYHPVTKAKLPEWMEEDKWLELQNIT